MSQIRSRTPSGAWSRSARAFLGAAACLVGALAPAPAARAGMAAMDPAVAQAEQDYITSTIDHHAGGVALANLALGTTTNQTLIDLSTSIRDTQSREIGELQGFLSDWYGRTSTPTISAMTQTDLSRLSTLQGRAFDVDYSQTFIEHHRTIIQSSQAILATAEHQALRDFAQGVIATQSAEIPVFQSVIDGAGGGPTPIPLPAPVAMGSLGLVVAGLATWRHRRARVA